MDKDLLDKILSSVAGSENKGQTAEKVETCTLSQCNLTEFVGAGIGDTVGLVIANLDYHLHENMKLDPKYRSIGIVSSRTGGAPHVMSADEAVKATNTEVVSVEFCRDTKGGAGHGSTIIFAAEDVSDARRAVEIMLSALDRNFGNVYGCDAGHIELHYTARASYALNKAFQAPIGKAFGITVGAPAAVGLLMADMAMKTANVDIVTYASPASGTCFSNEIIVTFSGDSGAVRQSVLAARDVGLSVLRGMGQNPVSLTKPTL
jgi:microcompartment protein PduB